MGGHRSLSYVRQRYGVPAKRGGRIRFRGEPGVITCGDGAHLRIRLDGQTRSIIVHPTWEMTYEDPAA